MLHRGVARGGLHVGHAVSDGGDGSVVHVGDCRVVNDSCRPNVCVVDGRVGGVQGGGRDVHDEVSFI